MEVEGFEVRVIDEEKGKGLFALRQFKEGDLILTEKPILCCQFSWNTDYGYLACDNCMLPLETAEENARRLTGKKDLILPYGECCETKKDSIVECPACGIKYCSAECLAEAYQKYHQTLCLQSRDSNDSHPLVQLKETWKQIYYPPETATIMLLARMIAYVNQSADKSVALATFGQFCNRTVNEVQEIAHNLLGEKYVGQIDVLRQALENALNAEFVPHSLFIREAEAETPEDVKCQTAHSIEGFPSIQPADALENPTTRCYEACVLRENRIWFTPDGFRSLLALVGTNGQGIGTSAFGRWVKHVSALELPEDRRIQIDKFIDRLYDDMDEVVGTFLNNEGSGLYLLQSTINHSCTPNAMVEFPYSNSTLVITATRDILPDEEICIGYLDECELERSRHSRQKSLSSLYLFVCRCDKCLAQAKDPDVTSDEEECEMSDEDIEEWIEKIEKK